MGGTVFENLEGSWRSEIEPQRGRLHVTIRQREEDNRAVPVLQLSARGPIEDLAALDDALELGHRTIVQAFDQFISTDARNLWERF